MKRVFWHITDRYAEIRDDLINSIIQKLLHHCCLYSSTITEVVKKVPKETMLLRYSLWEERKRGK